MLQTLRGAAARAGLCAGFLVSTAFAHFPGDDFSGGHEPLYDAARRYVTQVVARTEHFSDALGDKIERRGCLHCDVFDHKSVQRTAPLCYWQEPGCLKAVGWMAMAGLTPLAVAGAVFAPWMTFPLWAGLPFTVAVAYWKTGKTVPPLGKQHYLAVQKAAQEIRATIPWFDVFGWGEQPWSVEAFAAFEAAVRAHYDDRFHALDAEIERIHRPDQPPSDEEMRGFLDSYLNLWTLAALYDIEARRFTALYLAGTNRNEVLAQAEAFSFHADECRVALFRMGSPGYWGD